MSILCLVMHVLCIYALKLLSGFFSGLLWDKVWLILVKTGWQPCQKGPALCFVCACGERPKHFVEDMMNLMLLFS